MLSPFIKNNPNLTYIISISNCNLEEKEERLLALAICSSKHKSLQHLSLYESELSDKGLVDIIAALSFHPHLKHLDLDSNYLHINGCKALSTLLQHSATGIQYLDLSRNEINDEGIEALVPSLKKCSHLESLKLAECGYNVTTRGYTLHTLNLSGSLSEIMQSEWQAVSKLLCNIYQ